MELDALARDRVLRMSSFDYVKRKEWKPTRTVR